jgi:predicted outer membrane repeat protein
MSFGGGFGGAVYTDGSSAPVFENCVFTHNLSENDGGALYYAAGTTVILEGCTFSGNLAGTMADGDGGAVCVNTAEPESRITGCIFSGNGILGNYFAKGAGLYVTTTTITVTDTDFTDNVIDPPDSSDHGGAVYLHHTPRAVFQGCAFTGSTAGWGGAVYGNHTGSPTALYFDRCIFSGNTADSRGGAIYVYQADLYLLNTLVTGNTVTVVEENNNGGGAYVEIVDYEENTTRIFNANFVDNRAYDGGGLHIEAVTNSNPVLGNCIFWQNTIGYSFGKQINVGGHPFGFDGTMETCIVQNAESGMNFPSGYIDKDPLFVDAASGDYHLQSGSPAREGGTAALFDESVYGDLNGDGNTSDGIADFLDLDCSPRLIGAKADIGVYEY